MNGTFILITIFLYFGLLLLVARLTANRHTDNDAFSVATASRRGSSYRLA